MSSANANLMFTRRKYFMSEDAASGKAYHSMSPRDSIKVELDGPSEANFNPSTESTKVESVKTDPSVKTEEASETGEGKVEPDVDATDKATKTEMAQEVNGNEAETNSEKAGQDESTVPDDIFDSFMSNLGGGLPDFTKDPDLLKSSVPSQSSGLLIKHEAADEEARRLNRMVEVSEIDVKWGSGEEEVERILAARFREQNHFELFRLPMYASEELIRRHFKKLSVLIHPDKCKHPKAADAFHLIKTANTELLKPEYRTKYSVVVQEAREALFAERKTENKRRKMKGMTELLPLDEDSLRAAVIDKCEQILRDREERLTYADRTRKQNEEYEKAREEEVQMEEFEKKLHRQKWLQGQDERVTGWRSFREAVNLHKRSRVDTVDRAMHKARPRGL